MLISTIFNIAELLYKHGVRTAVLSPGSRNALLTMAFVRHPTIQTYTVSDERTAAFIAMGIAQQKLVDFIQNPNNQTNMPEGVALVCTSGSATLNYYPAIAEAFYQQIPLLVLTADRPPEWIDQQDGQTIRQRNVYQNHVKHSFETPANLNHEAEQWHFVRICHEATRLALSPPYAPVHINIPIREPFYPAPHTTLQFDRNIRQVSVVPTMRTLSKDTLNNLIDLWQETPQKMIVVGQTLPNPALVAILQKINQELHIPIVADTLSNCQHFEGCITTQDLLLQDTTHRQELYPQLLISLGNSLISKPLKQFLRLAKPTLHWHIQAEGYVADTFQTLTHHIPAEPTYFLEQLFADIDYQFFLEQTEEEDNIAFWEKWQKAQRKAEVYLHRFMQNTPIDSPLSDFETVYTFVQQIPPQTAIALHVANSMPVRYVNYVASKGLNQVEIYANRGTSGIDGCTSTAMGAAWASPDKLHILLTGDVAFFYDRNAFWHNYLPPNLRIILLNNGGGNIFRLIDAAQLPELEEYFETYQTLNAQSLAQEFGLGYYAVSTKSHLTNAWEHLWATHEKPFIIEIFTDKRHNATQWQFFKTDMPNFM